MLEDITSRHQQKLIVGLRPGRHRVRTHPTSFLCSQHPQRLDAIPNNDCVLTWRWTLLTSRGHPTCPAPLPPLISSPDLSFPASHLHSLRTPAQGTTFISKKNLFLRTDRARFWTNSIPSLCHVLPDLPCLLCFSFLASGAPGRPTFPPQCPMHLLQPHPLLVPPPCIRPLILSSTGLLPTPCGCALPATISGTLTPLAT